jgi:hypothetical protein
MRYLLTLLVFSSVVCQGSAQSMALSPWRRVMEDRLSALERDARQGPRSPQAPPIWILPSNPQTLPISPNPQTLPIVQNPQVLPLVPNPQPLPLAPNPQPIQVAPNPQSLPIAPNPQPVPVAPISGGKGSYIRLSWVPALWKTS